MHFRKGFNGLPLDPMMKHFKPNTYFPDHQARWREDKTPETVPNPMYEEWHAHQKVHIEKDMR